MVLLLQSIWQVNKMKREKLLALFLKVNAFFFSLAFPAVLLPGALMADLSDFALFGSLPQEPVVLYLARSLSVMYGMQGVLFWFISNDIQRYTPLIRLLAWIWVVSGTLFAAIDIFEGLPLYWAAAESVSAWMFGAVIFWLTEEV